MTTVLVPFYGYLNNRIKKLWNLTKIAKRGSFYFSSQDEVGANVIALDTQKRKLLYLKKTPGSPSCLIIDLNNLEKCSVKKEYNSIIAGELKTKKLNHFLKSIFLNLGFKNCSRTVALPFYIAETDSQEDVLQVEVKAKKWETIVSKLLPIQIRERA